MITRISSGESGVRDIGRDAWLELLSEEYVLMVVERTCRHYEIEQPELEMMQTKRQWKGLYFSASKTVRLSHLYQGLVLHELAHHVTSEVFGRVRRNGYHVHHGEEFSQILEEMYDMWGL